MPLSDASKNALRDIIKSELKRVKEVAASDSFGMPRPLLVDPRNYGMEFNTPSPGGVDGMPDRSRPDSPSLPPYEEPIGPKPADRQATAMYDSAVGPRPMDPVSRIDESLNEIRALRKAPRRDSVFKPQSTDVAPTAGLPPKSNPVVDEVAAEIEARRKRESDALLASKFPAPPTIGPAPDGDPNVAPPPELVDPNATRNPRVAGVSVGDESFASLFSGMGNRDGRHPKVAGLSPNEPSAGEYLLGTGEAALKSTIGTLARLVRNGDITPGEDTLIDRVIHWSEQDITDFVQKYGEDKIPYLLDEINKTASNLGYSLTSALAGAAAGIGTAALPVPGARALAYPAALAASASVAYRASRDQKLEALYNEANAIARDVLGRDLTKKEWGDIVARNDYENLARKHAAYEAIPEAIGQVLGFAIIRGSAGKVVGKAASKAFPRVADAVSKFIGKAPAVARTAGTAAARMTGAQIEEQGTELITNYNQQLADHIAGEPVAKPSIGQVLKDQALQVALLTGILGAGAHVGGKVYDNIKDAVDLKSLKSEVAKELGRDLTAEESADIEKVWKNPPKFRDLHKDVLRRQKQRAGFRKLVEEEERIRDAQQLGGGEPPIADEATGELDIAEIQRKVESLAELTPEEQAAWDEYTDRRSNEDSVEEDDGADLEDVGEEGEGLQAYTRDDIIFEEKRGKIRAGFGRDNVIEQEIGLFSDQQDRIREAFSLNEEGREMEAQDILDELRDEFMDEGTGDGQEQAPPQIKGAQEPSEDNEGEGPKKGSPEGVMLGEGEVVLTASGRQTTPFPKVGTDTDRKAKNTVRRVNQWLIDNVIAEAEARGDEHILIMFQNLTPENMSQSDVDSAHDYLFDEELKKEIDRARGGTITLKNLDEKPTSEEGRLLKKIQGHAGGDKSPEQSLNYASLGRLALPGVRSSDLEEAGRMYRRLKEGVITREEWDSYVDDLKSSGKAKEPWQMTRDEYRRAENEPKFNAIVGAIKKGAPIQVRTQYRVTPLTSPDHIRITRKGEIQTRERTTWVTLTGEQVDVLASQAGVIIPAFKDRVYHESIVGDALKEGKPVPEEVLADYPDLTKDSGEEAASTEEGAGDESEVVEAIEFKLPKRFRATIGNYIRIFRSPSGNYSYSINESTGSAGQSFGPLGDFESAEEARRDAFKKFKEWLDHQDGRNDISKADREIINILRGQLAEYSQEKESPESGPAVIVGSTGKAKTENGTEIEFEYGVYEAGDLIASNSWNDLKVNPDFPAWKQPRNRERMASEQQVQGIANNLMPERLGANPMASEGAPIIGPDRAVESGNARVIAMQRAFRRNKEARDRYKKWLIENAEQFGVDPNAVNALENPILVRQRTTDMTRDEVKRFVAEANMQSTAAMSASEQAKADADALDENLLDMFVPNVDGDINTAANREFVAGFLQRVAGKNEMGRYIDDKGRLSQDGLNRIRNALFAKAYGATGAVEHLSELTDGNIKVAINAMVTMAPKFAILKELIKKGQRHDYDITDDIAAAALKLSDLRRQGRPVIDYINQGEMFGGDISSLAKGILNAFETHKRSTKALVELFDTFINQVHRYGNPSNASLFESDEKPSKEELFHGVFEGGFTQEGTENLFGEDKEESGGENSAPSEKETSGSEESEVSPYRKVADFVKGKLSRNESITWNALFEAADEAFGGTQAEGKYTPKDAYDAMEAGVNEAIRERGLSDTVNDAAADIKHIRDGILARVPTQSKRTDETIEKQQFSTPPQFAYVANWVANLSGNDVYLEPSAGTGSLAVFGQKHAGEIYVNEIDDRRRSILEDLGFENVTKEDAEFLNDILPKKIKPTVIVMNPPFSRTQRKKGKKQTQIGATHVESALKRLQDGGRLVAIVGRGMEMDAPAFREWWGRIKRDYTVRANVGVSGDEYRKYGTSFDNRILVIDKIKPSSPADLTRDRGALITPAKGIVTGEVRRVEELLPLLEGVRNERTHPSKPSAGKSGGEGSVSKGSEDASESETPVRPPTRGVGGSGGSGRSGSGTRRVRGESSPREGSGGGVSTPEGERGPRERDTDSAGRDESPESRNADNRRDERQDDGEQNAGIGLEKRAGKGPKQEDKSEDSDEVVYSHYTPNVTIKGAKPHPAKLVESIAMGAVDPPPTDYTPSIDKKIIEQGRLSNAQLEAIIYAGAAHSQILPTGERKGYYIGDGTGVGKGREISGIILDNWNQGRKKAVWLSQNWKLLKDAKRDLRGVGWNDAPLVDHSKYGLSATLKDEQGILFSTYGTLRSEKDQVRRVDQIVDWLGEDFDGVIVFDESHNMGNAMPKRTPRGEEPASLTARAGVELQSRLPNARIVYVSVTGAKEIRNLAYAPRLGLWGEGTPFGDVRGFVGNIDQGGVAALEVVARDLKMMGLYTARSISFNGVKYERMVHSLTDEQKQVYDEMAVAWQSVMNGFEEFIDLNGLPSREAGNHRSALYGSVQRFYNGVLTATSVPTMIKGMEADIASGHAPVIQIVNTDEAGQDREIVKMQTQKGDIEDIDLSPRDVLENLIENYFPTTQWVESTDPDGNTVKVPLLDSEGNPVESESAVRKKNELLDMIRSLPIPESALAQILNHFGTNRVAEVTGRSRRVVQDHRTKEMKIEKRSESKKEKEIQEFLDGKRDILIFSMAGGTGASYHAGLEFKNQKMRRHYVLQAGWQADRAIQGLGRSHRSNQKQPPEFILVTTDVPAQLRFTATIAKRLDQMGALTKGQRETGGGGLFSSDANIESQYGQDATRGMFADIVHGRLEGFSAREIEERMGIKDLLDDEGQIRQNKLPNVSRFLNRLLMTPLDTMAKYFGEFDRRFQDNVQAAIENGTYDAGIETVPVQSININQEDTVYRHPTGAETKYYGMDIEVEEKIIDFADVMRMSEGLYKNKKSGKVWGVGEVRNFTHPTSGQVYQAMMLTNVNGRREKVRVDEFEGRYDKIPADQEEPAWKEEMENAPKTKTRHIHMITGALIPIWDKLPTSDMKIQRISSPDQSILGRIIDQDDIADVLRRLGSALDAQKVEIQPKHIPTEVLRNNKRIILDNNWYMQKSRVSGEDRIELKGPNYYDENRLFARGVFKETINNRPRYFIPVGERAVPTIHGVLEGRTIMSVVRRNENSDEEHRYSFGGQFTQGINEVLENLLRSIRKPRYNISESVGVQPLEIEEESWAQWTRRMVQDKMTRLEYYQKKLPDMRNEIDAYMRSMLFIGRASERIAKFEQEMVDGKDSFLKRLTDAGYTVDEFGEYLYARHAKERNAHIREVNPKRFEKDEEFTGSGMSDEEADAILRDYEDGAIVDFADEFYEKVTERALKIRLDAGLIDDKTYDLLSDHYQNYVPLKGHADVTTYPKLGKGFSVTGKDIRRARGRKSLANNPFIQALADYNEAIIRAEKNRVGMTFLRMVMENPNKDLWEVESLKYLPRYNKHGEIEYLDPRYKMADNILEVKVKGKTKFIHIKDPALSAGMKNLGVERGSKLLNSINAYLRAVNTLINPEFIITNFERDLQTALIHLGGERSAKLAVKVTKDIPKAMRGIWRNVREGKENDWSRLYEEMKMRGGKVGWFDYKTIEEKTKDLERKAVRFKHGDLVRENFDAVKDFIIDINEVVESAARLSAYKNLIDAGVSRDKAAQAAKNLTVDFNKKGAYGQLMNSLWLFSNAGVQGSARILSALKHKKVRAAVIGLMAMSFLQSAINRMVNPDDYEQFSDWTKDNYWIFMIPGTNKSVVVKVPYGYNIFKVMGNIAEEVIFGNITLAEAGSRLFNAFQDAFNPLGGGSLAQFISPTALDPFVQVAENKNFFGGPIRKSQPLYAPKLPDSQLYFPGVRGYTKALATWLNEATGGNGTVSGWADFNPENIDHVIDFIGGGTGKAIANAFETGRSLLEEWSLPDLHNVPVARQIIKAPSDWTASTKVYEMLDESARTIYSEKEQGRFYRLLELAVMAGAFSHGEALRRAAQFRHNQNRAQKSLERKE